MSWDAVAAISSIAATAAIVVTLIYIAKQVRLNASQVERAIQLNRTQNSHFVLENFNAWRNLVLAPGNASIWLRGLNDLDSLDREEKLTFNLIAGSVMWSCWFTYQLQRNEGLVADVNSELYRDLYKHPGFRAWLTEHRRYHTDEFGDFLDDVCESVGSERLQPGESSSLTDGLY